MRHFLTVRNIREIFQRQENTIYRWIPQGIGYFRTGSGSKTGGLCRPVIFAGSCWPR